LNALYSRYSQKAPRTLGLSGTTLPTWENYDGITLPVLIPTYLHGVEAIGESFVYTVRARTDVDAPSGLAVLDLDKITGSSITVSIEIPGKGTASFGRFGDAPQNIGATTREITGIVSEARFVRRDDRSQIYEFVLRPILHQASLGQDYRIFQGLNVVQITDLVLQDYPITIDWRIAGPLTRSEKMYPVRDLQRQHWESDAKFLQRLWEEWGLFYWFTHSKGFHRLVIADTLHGAQQSSADQSDVTKAIRQQHDELRGTRTGGRNDFPEFAKPHITLSSPAGIETSTEGSTHLQSDRDTAITTGRSVGVAAGKSFYASVLETISLYVRKAGMTLVAAAGKIRVQAQTGSVEIDGQTGVQITSVNGWVEIRSPKGIRLNGGGT
jgi:hypothetical protein